MLSMFSRVVLRSQLKDLAESDGKDSFDDEELCNLVDLAEAEASQAEEASQAGQSEASNVKDGEESRDEAMKDGDALEDDIFNDGLDEELLALVDVIESGNNVEEVKEDIDDFEELGLTPPSDEINIFLFQSDA